MSTGVYIFGVTGRMGQKVKEIVENTDGLEFVGGLSLDPTDSEPLRKPDVVIDFSLPDSLPTLKTFLQAHRCALVSGITGYQEKDFAELQSLSKNGPVFWSANMSFGVYLMCQLTEALAKFDRFYKFQIEETHHIHKKDKPSGTALIVERAARKSTNQLEPIVSHREGEVFGIHTFTATSKYEEISIRHEAKDRALFAQGAVDVAQWLVNQGPGYYGMDDFFKNFQ